MSRVDHSLSCLPDVWMSAGEQTRELKRLQMILEQKKLFANKYKLDQEEEEIKQEKKENTGEKAMEV